MFLLRRPSPDVITRFLRESEALALSSGHAGIVHTNDPSHDHDEVITAIGRGQEDFASACAALRAWTQFDVGWVETFPRDAPLRTGVVVAVLIRHFGFWSLNGCRIIALVGNAADDRERLGFVYGTLTNHAEDGEELFEVFSEPRTGEVIYRLRAASRPRVPLTRLGYPIVRLLQARFRRHSVAAMMRAVRARATKG